MTLKDWKLKQTSDEYSIWLRNDVLLSLQIIKFGTGSGYRYRVIIEGNQFKTIRRDFSNRPSALKYAKSFMKTH